ncbi:hypothetical protein G4B88_005129 [Cannabis sativa]|uniref:CCHC-type domain-containing protein n=1 Tax=Cannabis sativa TaxID=3483 RepID=A0A7J6EUF9_CANSA|nr:hypothetical protein G4B88_005129 [Cannabis sativa]
MSGTTNDAVEEIVNMDWRWKLKMTGKMWKNIGEWRVKVIEEANMATYVRISFDLKEDAQLILEKQPWLFNGGILLLEEWPLSDRWQDARLKRVVCWVKMKGFVLKSFTVNNVKRLAQLAGDVLEIKWSDPQQAFMNGYVREKIGFPLNKSVFVGRFVPTGTSKSWVQLKFERLPMLCFNCGFWGHDQADCKELPAMEDIGEGQKVLKYGYWLKDEHPTPNCIVAHKQNAIKVISEAGKNSGADYGLKEKAAATVIQAEIGWTRGMVMVSHEQGSEVGRVSGVVAPAFGGKEVGNLNDGQNTTGPDTSLGPMDCPIVPCDALGAQASKINTHMNNSGPTTYGRTAGGEVSNEIYHSASRKEVRGNGSEDEGEGDQKKRKGGAGFVVTDSNEGNGKKNKGKEILSCPSTSNSDDKVPLLPSLVTEEHKGRKGVSHGQRRKISIKNRARHVHREKAEMGHSSSEQMVEGINGFTVVGCSQDGTFVFGAATETNNEAQDTTITSPEDDINIRIDSSSPGHILVEVAGKDFLPWTGLCNEEWLSCFEGANIRVLDWWESDHRPLLVDLPVAVERERCGQTKRKTRFHFEEAWCDDDECKDIVLNEWHDGWDTEDKILWHYTKNAWYQSEKFTVLSMDNPTTVEMSSTSNPADAAPTAEPVNTPVISPAPAIPSSPFQSLAFLTIKLEGTNYPYWRSQALPALRAHELEGYVLGTKPCPPQFVDNTVGGSKPGESRPTTPPTSPLSECASTKS